MKPDPRHSDLSLSREDELLVQQGSELSPRQSWQRAASWREIRARIDRRDRRQLFTRPRALTWVGLGLGGAVAGVFLSVVSQQGLRASLRPSGSADSRSQSWRDIALGPIGHLSLAPGTRLRLPTPEPGPDDPYRVTLDEGQLCAQVNHRDPVRQGPFQVDAQGLRIVDLGTRFCVVAGQGPSWVSVEEGRVQVHGAAPEAVLLSGGESLSADDPRLTNPPPPPEPSLTDPTLVAAPTPRPPTARRTQGSELSIENARYEAGMRARDAHRGPEALAIWEEYRRRFPQGVFVAEVDLLRLRELAAEGKASSVLAAAEEFARAHPGHWRGAEAELIRADTLRLQLARPAEALPVYERIRASERQTALGERALYGLCLSLHAISKEAEAKEDAREYLRRFPAGAHRVEMERLSSAN